MNKKDMQKLVEMPVISKENLKLLQDNSNSSFDSNIKTWLKNGTLIKLKKGIYTTKFFIEKEGESSKFGEFISSILEYPSYLSREYIMQQYGMLTDVSYGYTAVTNKKTQNIINKFGNYYYSFIREKLFCGYEQREYKNNSYFVATKAKALFDFLYFKKRLFSSVNKNVAEELRLNLEDMTPSDYLEFEKYLEIAESVKMARLYKALRKVK